MFTCNENSESGRGNKLNTENLSNNNQLPVFDCRQAIEEEIKACWTEKGEIFDKNKCNDILQTENQHSTGTILKKPIDNLQYLKNELMKVQGNYTLLQAETNFLKNKLMEVTEDNNWLRKILQNNCISDTSPYRANCTDNLTTFGNQARLCQGNFQHRYADLDIILQRLVSNFTPALATTLLPGLPAYIIFMCIRYTDLMKADDHVRDIITKYVVLMRTALRLPELPEDRLLWLVNAIQLHNLLKQYGRIDEYMKLNTDSQNQQQLKNFDLSEFRNVIYELITNIYTKLVQQVEELLKPYIVPSILDDVSRIRIISHRKYPSASPRPPNNLKSGLAGEKTLINQLENFYKQFVNFGLPLVYIEQIFMQLFSYICAIAMNSLMLRGEVYMWKTGMQIRSNINSLETWATKKNLPKEVLSPLQPLNQVSSLLQARKGEEDVKYVYEQCSLLNTAQVLKLLKSFNPGDYEEDRIPNVFIEKLTAMLHSDRTNKPPNDKFTMDENYIFALKDSYEACTVNFEEIELPMALDLNDLLTKL